MDLSKTEHIACPLCNNDVAAEKYSVQSWKIMQCRHCRFVYVNPRLQKSELYNLYTADYFNNKIVGYYHYTESKELRKKNFSRWVSDALPYLQQKILIKALDVGCAAGYCLEVFEEQGWQPFGIELDSNVARALQHKGFTVFNTPLLHLPNTGKYSVITMFDVIEHLTDLHENVSILHNMLEADGILIIVTPDYGSWQRRIFRKEWFQFKPLEHINYFTLSALKQLAWANGLEIVAIKKSGQFCDVDFLKNRLLKYNFRFLLPFFGLVLKIFRLKGKNFYIDTASLYVV
jgi:SAM-dependent methyltransferase